MMRSLRRAARRALADVDLTGTAELVIYAVLVYSVVIHATADSDLALTAALIVAFCARTK